MNKKLNLLILSLLASVLTFSYLTFHHYSLLFGTAHASLCQISNTLNCDAAALSSYSEFLGIPIAVIGLCFSFILLLIILTVRLGWVEMTPFMSHSLQFLLLGAFGFSLFLAAISTFQLKVFCPFCFLSYFFIFINCILLFTIYPLNLAQFNLSDLSDHKGFITSLLTVLLLAWFSSSTIMTSFGYDELKKMIPEKISQWKQMPLQNFNLELGLIKGQITGTENSLVEFADFKCPHCKSAAEAIKNFTKSNPRMKVIFKPFPLDGNCNPHVSFKGDGSRCQMAGLVMCSEKLAQKGWPVHDYFFAHQETLSQVADVKPQFIEFANTLNMNSDEIIKCSESSETYDLLRKMADEAKVANVEGTPTLFMNSQKLGYGQFLQVLNEAYKTLK